MDPGQMTPRTRHALRNLISIITISSSLASLFSYISADQQMSDLLHGAIDGACISALSASYFIFGIHGIWRRQWQRLNFLITLLINIIVQIGFFFLGRLIGQSIARGSLTAGVIYTFTDQVLSSFLFALTLSIILSGGLQLNRLIGPGILWHFVTGRYHTPREEAYVMLFLDLVGSTRIAERIGHRRFYQFLNAVFMDATDAVLATNGMLYDYVGDEIKVAWRWTPDSAQFPWIDCPFLVEAMIQRRAAWYQMMFGTVPHFRASLHGGVVMVGEIGDIKQKLAFVGDVLHSTARLLEYARNHTHAVVASGEVVRALADSRVYTIELAEVFQPHGQETWLEVYVIERQGQMAETQPES